MAEGVYAPVMTARRQRGGGGKGPQEDAPLQETKWRVGCNISISTDV